ncbi:uncharacterized protein L969DRAFT_92854 [Mixia osmundae IAM 14324]|uniref:Amino acid permease/ SLC12A domain-containing protein n=1 Tax=Mixia osmundae (strain CBS 9802 / IAM 14324 / JCM 22182 / KY 12970) TaxID=764103 RepID=G7DYR9_MIXOS|nr:uncharacterized protein L969DRAFT_92854 [Mixia osmundae IAM 14324]KEI41628.1 hypothetical protein L969DRAFT_92854 [Mixia osmundae IAM 14324]GAA95729.1 hypothetical protein E5Q_02386 [Mixia osmundae IAM 14324]
MATTDFHQQAPVSKEPIMESRPSSEKKDEFPRHELHNGGRDGVTVTEEESADAALLRMGYQPVLIRNRSTLQVVFMCSVLASIPYGLATTMYYSLLGGGPANVIWGWVGLTFVIACVALSLGEICSVYPSASGVYFFTFMLAPKRYRKIASYICGYAFVAGNITITLAVNFGTTLFLVASINLFESSPGVGIFAAEAYQVFLVFLGITLLCNAISAFGNRFLPLLDTFAIFWNFAGIIAILIVVLVLAKEGRHNAKYVFTNFDPSNSGWPRGWSFMIGLLQAAYATSSTGMIVSMCEEVAKPETQVPKAMLATVFVNGIFGVLFLLPLLFVLPDLAYLVALPSGQPVPAILKSAVGSSGGAFGLLVPLLVLGLLCGVACTTAASRCTWAFSRDGAIPGSRWWGNCNKSLDVPLNAMMLSMAIQIGLGAIYFGSYAAFNAFSGSGVILLTISYAVPIIVSFAEGRQQIRAGKYYWGSVGFVANVVAIAWSILAVPLFCMPSYIPITAAYINYASAVLIGVVLISAAWYGIWGRKHYQGPPVHEDAILEAHLAETDDPRLQAHLADNAVEKPSESSNSDLGGNEHAQQATFPNEKPHGIFTEERSTAPSAL